MNKYLIKANQIIYNIYNNEQQKFIKDEMRMLRNEKKKRKQNIFSKSHKFIFYFGMNEMNEI